MEARLASEVRAQSREAVQRLLALSERRHSNTSLFNSDWDHEDDELTFISYRQHRAAHRPIQCVSTPPTIASLPRTSQPAFPSPREALPEERPRRPSSLGAGESMFHSRTEMERNACELTQLRPALGGLRLLQDDEFKFDNFEAVI